jgi:hypothetical protein
MPRPTKYTRERQDAITAAVAAGSTFEQAAAAAGIHRDTLTEWRKGKPAFSDALEKAEAMGVVSRLERIQAAGRDGVWQADAWWLERRHPEQWGRRDRVRLQHEGTVTVEMLVEARTAVLHALEAYPEARLAVADALEQVEASKSEKEKANGERAD